MIKGLWNNIKSAGRAIKETLRFSTAARWFTTSGTTVSWENSSYTQLVKLAMRNPIARRAIDFIGDNLANIDLQLVRVDDEGETEDIGEHPLLELLRRPGGKDNSRYTKEWLFKGFVWALMGGGEFWLRAIGPDMGPNAGEPRRLWIYDASDFMEFLVERDTGFVTGYRLREDRPNLQSRTIEGDTSEILHAFNFNPQNKFRGLSILHSVFRQLQLIENAEDWNKAIAESKGQVPGFFKPTGLDGDQQLSPATRQQAQDQVDEHVNNSREGHKWQVLSGAYEPIERNITPKEAEWIEGSKHWGRLISTGIGIDPVLLGDESAKTYNNFSTAFLIAHISTILPMFNFVLSALNRWYVPKWAPSDEKWMLTFDPMEIDALEEQNLQKIERIVKAVNGPILSPDEGRQIVNYDTVGADSLLVPINIQTHNQLFEEEQIDGQIDNIQSIGKNRDEVIEQQIKDILYPHRNGNT
jgi:phage portal protein BeeE